ncbi:mannosyltransferase [Colletotrichum higginsianum]|nr:mannosyltransferase [Colletotrichum higginsianum]
MLARHASHPRQTLVAAFVAWKVLLLAIALGSAVAPSYDTSTTLMLRRNESDLSIVTRLTRWDALYFTQSARRGYLFEQEWAFNAGLPLIVLCAFFSFAGYYVLASISALPKGSLSWTGGQILAGAIFGLATASRSNGLLNGLPFAIECLMILPPLLASPTDLKTFAALFGPVTGGLLVATGSVVPQALAWLRYCSGASEPRAWCARTVPSIYSFVQEHYWGVGLFRYWTPSNVPLFILAAPVLGLLIVSGWDVMSRPSGLARSPTAERQATSPLVFSMATIQVLLAVLAITTYHVQIITRIASGYAVWYWWVAGCLLDDGADGKRRDLGNKIVTFSVMYAAIQGVLFASFLPPA